MSAPRSVALVTGCGKSDGIGAAIARRLAHEGRIVVVTDRDPLGVANVGESAPSANTSSGLDDLVAVIERAGGTAVGLLADIADPGAVSSLMSDVHERFGRLDILVNNAAAPQGADRADISEVPLDDWNVQMRVNLTGTFLMSQAAVELMRPQRSGRIIMISSMAALDAAGKSTAYSASKAGVLGFVRSLAMDVAGWGITVNAICPGLVGTSRAMLGRHSEEREAAMQVQAARIPVGRVGVPDDIAHVAAFLAQEASGYITAQAIAVDGGGLSPFPLSRPDND